MSARGRRASNGSLETERLWGEQVNGLNGWECRHLSTSWAVLPMEQVMNLYWVGPFHYRILC